MTRSEEIIEELREFITPKCELDFSNNFELVCAVLMSAQTTDKSVNKVTPILFGKYPTPYEMARASINDVEDIIRPIGLAHNKANSVVSLSKVLIEDFNGVVPNTMDDLLKLPGVGRKSASVVLALGFGIPAFPVDTHVSRVAVRLKMAKKSDSVLEIEKRLERAIPKSKWIDAHHLLLLFGRYTCTSKNPKCSDCKMVKYCTEAQVK